MDELEKARKAINDLDEKMADLFSKRMDAVKTIAIYKKKNALPIEDKKRESEVVQKNTEYVCDEYKSCYRVFIKDVMDISKSYQKTVVEGMRVAFSGCEGAFAHIVSKKIFPDALLVSCRDFSEAFSKVENGECMCAVLPVENSFNGDVTNVMDLAFFGNLYITGIYEAGIVHNLLGKKKADISKIKTVISHPQALEQCRGYIEKHSFLKKDEVNTAAAAKFVSETNDETIAAIASTEAAEKFGLSVIESHINDNRENTTRFAVFSVSQDLSSAGNNRFILMFTVNNTAGALSKAINVIGKFGFNLMSLKSRPSKDIVWNYYFYAEGEGDISSQNGKKMIEELKKCCKSLKILGSYKNCDKLF